MRSIKYKSILFLLLFILSYFPLKGQDDQLSITIQQDGDVYIHHAESLPFGYGFNIYRRDAGGEFNQINEEVITTVSSGPELVERLGNELYNRLQNDLGTEGPTETLLQLKSDQTLTLISSFSDPDIAEATCDARDYFDLAQRAIKEMYRQVGDLETDERGMAYRGLMIRHLVMPEDIAGTEKIMEFIAEEISVKTYINIMDQYYPRGKVKAGSQIDRPITYGEDRTARKIAMEKGLERISD